MFILANLLNARKVFDSKELEKMFSILIIDNLVQAYLHHVFLRVISGFHHKKKREIEKKNFNGFDRSAVMKLSSNISLIERRNIM